jgi:hypothetical protein
VTQKEKKFVTWLTLTLVVVIVMQCLGMPGTDLIVLVPLGWIAFLWHVFPQIRFHWPMIFSSLVYLLLLFVGSHLFLRWLYGQITKNSVSIRSWKWRWTFSAVALVFLMFIAGMAAIGIVHQTGWLFTEPGPMFKSNMGERANRVKCMSNLRQIGYALDLYATDNGGKYPDDFRALILHEDITDAVFVCPSSNDESDIGLTGQQAADSLLKPHNCSYIYLGKGLSSPVDAKRVIALEPLSDHDGEGISVLFGDGSVRFVEMAEAEKMLAKLGVSATTQP